MRKPTTKNNRSLMVTELADFYRCNGDEGMRYYPATQSRKAAAIDYNGGTFPPTVKGFAVYDTTVSMDYAVALYGSAEEAEQHEAAPVPAVPDTIFDDEPTVEIEENDTEPSRVWENNDFVEREADDD